MAEEGLVPSPEEDQKRKVVIEKLKEVSLVVAFSFCPLLLSFLMWQLILLGC